MNGTVAYFENKIQINEMDFIRNNQQSQLVIKNHLNYIFITESGAEINATLLNNEGFSYTISDKDANTFKLQKGLVKSIKSYSDTLNQTKILPTMGKYLYQHEVYSYSQVNAKLCNSMNLEVAARASFAKKNLVLGRKLLKTAIISCALGILGSSIILIGNNVSLLNADEFLPFIAGGGIALALPFAISGSILLNKGKSQNQKAIDLHNKVF